MANSAAATGFLSNFLSVSLLLCLLLLPCLGERAYAFEDKEVVEKENLHHLHQVDEHNSHRVEISSLFPSSVCSSSNRARKSKSSLQVVHRHGPCVQPPSQAKAASAAAAKPHTDLLDILRRDQARVDSIQTKLSKARSDVKQTESAGAELPAKDGSAFGSGNYLVTVGLGTPKKDLSLIFDTGSDLTWTQCAPCVRSCYVQKEPIFNPTESSSYSNVSCSSPLCSSLSSATGNTGSCSSSTCVYGIQYGDSSFSVGFFAKEKLTLTNSDVFPGFLFGCGENNQGLFGNVAGLLGLGRDNLSLPSQTAASFKKLFSYCLPSSSSSSGHLTFGSSSSASKPVKFTPLSSISRGTSFYGVDITAISVAGVKLTVPSSVFSAGGSIIDSGTVITRLPPKAYAALRSAFRSRMEKYKRAEALSILDTCYDLSGYTTVRIPKIGFSFNGAVEVDIPSRGILYGTKVSQVCLAFAGNSEDASVGIFGNVQQQTLEVVYDGAGGRVGFAPGGCD